MAQSKEARAKYLQNYYQAKKEFFNEYYKNKYEKERDELCKRAKKYYNKKVAGKRFLKECIKFRNILIDE
jgi:hypothetical protein